MKPTSLCFVQMGNKGLELVKAFPEVLPQSIIDEIVVKSMPLGAKEGDFTSNVISEDNAFSSYVFSIPSNNGRDNIGSLVAVFDNTNYNANDVRRLFSILISELRNNNAVNSNILAEILPTVFKSFGNKNVKIKISSIVTVEIDFMEDDKHVDSKEKIAKSLSDDLW
ncbi:MAG: hypothetical protein JXA54_08470 [Candidatus Heimdallarchaeota archaeon]|nr:hypothetical protein [Candidatus Heimdallarchaeota archaeon]